MRIVTFALLAASALALAGGASGAAGELAPSSACPSAGTGAEAKRAAMQCLVNYAREANGAGPLGRSQALDRAAGAKGESIVDCGDFSHSPCGSSSIGPVQKAGYRYRLWGENLYWGSGPFASARSAVRGWLRSPGHRRAMLDPRFREIGIAAVAWPRRGTVWVIELGRR